MQVGGIPAGLPLGLGVLDGAGRVVFANDDLASLFGQDAPQLIGQDLVRFVEQPQRPAARKALRQATRTGRVSAASWRVRGIGPRPFESRYSPGPWPGSMVTSSMSSSRRASNSSATIRCSARLSWPRSPKNATRPSSASGPGEAIEFGTTPRESFSVGRKKRHWVPRCQYWSRRTGRSRRLSCCRRAWAGEVIRRVETVRICKQGSRVEVSVSLAPLRDRSGHVTGVSQVIRDITQQKASERALAFQAMHDHLTGLPNRSLLEDRMAHALERCRREGQSIGVMFFDLDHFKTVNDTAGHDVGDKLLRAVASRLRQSVRSVDTVARMGGDEFVVLVEDITDDAQLDVVVSHIMGSFTEPVVLADRQLWVSVSAGVVSGGPSSTVAQLLSQADAAMYQAKGRARGSVCHYDPRTRPDLEKRAEGSRLLRLALEAHQLMTHYQPIVDLHTGSLVGAEALVRWQDPLRGLVPAKDFVPLAEELGLVGEIGDVVLAEVASQVKQWSKMSPDFKVAVNVSPLQLRGTSLMSSVRGLMNEGLEPGSIVLEVTESAIMEDATTSTSMLGELREAGFGIAIDDFGTGYSSLAYLKQLPATTIKVDQAFTSQLPDPHDLSIVMAILSIADTYGLDVVAEGIETAEQAEMLKELGCPQGQGYHFARPVPAGQLTSMLEVGKLPITLPTAPNGAGVSAHREPQLQAAD